MNPVVILGAGINGCAVARELALAGLPVLIVERNDIAFGATARSSRLIHGGLRYLEYRDFALVSESLRERERLLRLAPQFVKPLRLSIPLSGLLGGLIAGALRFSGLARLPGAGALISGTAGRRGLMSVGFGLSLYDWLAGASSLPEHTVRRVLPNEEPKFDARQFPWRAEYSDAMITWPERFTLAMLHDARAVASLHGQMFEILTRHFAEPTDDGRLRIISVRQSSATDGAETHQTTERIIEPSLVINATGAWGDRTLHELNVERPALFAGTRGSHLFTHSSALRVALGGQGVYAEASDGRMVFILPCADGVLIGTTDDPFSGDPGSAVASSSDIDYLLRMVRDVFPEVELTREEITLHEAGVRPLPSVKSASTAAVPRGHAIEETLLPGTAQRVTVLTLIGGKLTTCRALAEDVWQRVAAILNRPCSIGLSRERPFPGAQDWPLTEEARQAIAVRSGLSRDQIDAVARLCGNRFEDLLADLKDDGCRSLTGTSIPIGFVRWSIREEWVAQLDDLIERRLMLIFDPTLRRTTLVALAEELVRAGRLSEEGKVAAIETVIQRLARFYGRQVLPD